MKLPKPIDPDKHPIAAADLDAPVKSTLKIHGDKKSLAIALVASFVFLLGAVGTATWMFVQKGSGNTVINEVDPNSTVNVKKTVWVAPKMAEDFKTYNQSTNSAEIVYYPNESKGCSITAGVIASGEETKLAQTAASVGDGTNITAKTVAASDKPDVTFKDSDGQREYDFKTAPISQETTAPNVSEKRQTGVVYYKQFGNDLASVRYVCKTSTVAAHADLLEELIKQFQVTTER